MLNQKSFADKAGSESMARDLFNRGLSRESAGSKSLKTATAESYSNAQQAFSDAEKLYKKAWERAEQITIEIRTEMNNAKTLVPVFKTDIKTIPAYKQAADFEAGGSIKFSQGLFNSARDLFRKARDSYTTAKNDIVTILKNDADNAKNSMEAVKSKISKGLNAKNKYKDGQESELAGIQFYKNKDYLKAADQFNTANNLYSELNTESERIILDKQMLEAAHLAIQEKAEKLKSSFLKGSPDELKNVLVFVDDDDQVWNFFFSSIRNIEVDLNIDNFDSISIESNRQEVYFSMKITYLNKTNNSNMDAVMKFSGILQKDGMGGWTLSKLGIMN